MEIFNFCPNSQVPELLPREQGTVMSMGGWTFASKPTTPFVKTHRLTLHGLRWYLTDDGFYDAVTNVDLNAKALEEFYERHELWNPFLWTHPHTGRVETYRFKTPVTVPKGLPNSDGFIEALEVQLTEHNPGYST
jgi:hypothetical protein